MLGFRTDLGQELTDFKIAAYLIRNVLCYMLFMGETSNSPQHPIFDALLKHEVKGKLSPKLLLSLLCAVYLNVADLLIDQVIV